MPVIFLTDSADGKGLDSAELTAVTDCLAIPFSLPMLRTRVRTWLMRALAQPAIRSNR